MMAKKSHELPLISGGVVLSQPDVTDNCWQLSLFYSLSVTAGLLPPDIAYPAIRQVCQPDEVNKILRSITLNFPDPTPPPITPTNVICNWLSSLY